MGAVVERWVGGWGGVGMERVGGWVVGWVWASGRVGGGGRMDGWVGGWDGWFVCALV